VNVAEAAAGVLHQQDLAGLQLALADRQRADDVVGDDAAGVAQHVHSPICRPNSANTSSRESMQVSTDGVQRGWHRKALGTRLRQVTAARPRTAG
jgi:hypothetical protein